MTFPFLAVGRTCISEAIDEGSNKNRIFIAFAIEWNSGMESRASDQLLVLAAICVSFPR
jgi:hypothetical protein